MERYILHITTEETYVSGQIFAVRDFDEALEVIKQQLWIDFEAINQEYFRENYYCTTHSLFSGNGVDIEMMSPLEYHALIKQEYEARRSEVIRLCGELSASAIEEGAKQ